MTRLVTVFATILLFAGCTGACTPTGASAASGDVLGAGGHQDDLARAIYHPGSGTDW